MMMTGSIVSMLLPIAVSLLGTAFITYKVCRRHFRKADLMNIKTWLHYQKAWLKNSSTYAQTHDHISSSHCLLNANRCLENAKSLGYLTTVFDSDLENVKTLNEQQDL